MERTDDTSRDWARPFAAFAALQATSALGMGFAMFAVAFRLLESTGSPTTYGVVAAGSLVPAGLASPWIGGWIDRAHPRRVTAVCAAASALSVVALAGIVGFDLQSPIYAWVSLSIAYLSLTAQYSAEVPYARGLVPTRHLSRANAGLQLTALVPRLGGTAVASFAFARGTTLSLAIAIAALIVAAGILAGAAPWTALRTDRQSEDCAAESKGAIAVTFRLLGSNPVMIALIVLVFARRCSIDALGVLIHPLVLAHGTAELVGLVMGAGTLGFALAGVVLVVARVERPLLWIVAASGAAAIAMLALWAGSTPGVLIAGTLVMYASDLTTITTHQLWWQRAAPVSRLGRITSIRDVLTGSGGLVGSLLAGPASAAAALYWGLSAGGGAAAVLAGLALLIVMATIPVIAAARRAQPRL